MTAFEAFGKSPISSSWEVARQFIGLPNFIVECLPVSYQRAEQSIVKLIEIHRPDLVLMLGQAGAHRQVRVENIAINCRDVALADSDGYVASKELIDPSEPMALFAPVEVCALRDAIKARGVATIRSNTAGLFVCNATFFRALAYQAEHCPQVPIVFLHYPILPEQQKDYPERFVMSLEDMTTAARTVIDYYRSDLC